MLVKVAQRRKELGMSQDELAKLTGIGQHTVSDIETGRHVPKVDIAILIAKALLRSVEELFVIDEDGAAHPLSEKGDKTDFSETNVLDN